MNTSTNTYPAKEPVILRCACCGLPFAKLRDGYIEIESKHHGGAHVNRLSVATLAELSKTGIDIVKK